MSKLLNSIQREIYKRINNNIFCSEWHNSIILEGTADKWQEVTDAGFMAANRGYKGVINKLRVKELEIPNIKEPLIEDLKLHNKNVDVLIIGGGIIGASIARELSKWNISILLIDKESDLAMHASSRNDGMVHPGIEPKPGSKKAYYNVKGNKMYEKVCKELDVPFRRSGSIILFQNKLVSMLKPLVLNRAMLNGVEGVKFFNRDEVLKKENFVRRDVVGGIFFPTTAIIPPYKMTIAYAENAVMNGVEVSLNTIAKSINKDKNKILSINTNRGTIHPKVVINAGGVFADKIAEMAGDQFFTIHPRKGHLAFLDSKKGNYLGSVVALPSLKLRKGHTKGGGLIRTIEGNILVGPDAFEEPYKEDYSTDRNKIDSMLQKQLSIIPNFCRNDVITYCAGIRAATYEEDFIIEKSEYISNLIYASGIQSPGFASAPAIAEEIEKITVNFLKKIIEVKQKANWNPIRKGIVELKNMNIEERNKFIKNRKDYGIIICRCEEISKGEIIDAINSPIPVNTLDGIKRRVRAGMGRCQGGFCTPQILEIIKEETGLEAKDITKKGNNSNLIVGETKCEG